MTYKDEVNNTLKHNCFHGGNRLFIDDHLFACIGNGFDWKGGQLLEKEWKEIPGKEDEVSSPDYETHSSKELPDYIEDRTYKAYPLCEYSSMCLIPEDVQSDWFEAIEHFVNYLLEKPEERLRLEYGDQVEILEEVKRKINKLWEKRN